VAPCGILRRAIRGVVVEGRVRVVVLEVVYEKESLNVMEGEKVKAPKVDRN
jgi:hypothetical protein